MCTLCIIDACSRKNNTVRPAVLVSPFFTNPHSLHRSSCTLPLPHTHTPALLTPTPLRTSPHPHTLTSPHHTPPQHSSYPHHLSTPHTLPLHSSHPHTLTSAHLLTPTHPHLCTPPTTAVSLKYFSVTHSISVPSEHSELEVRCKTLER